MSSIQNKIFTCPHCEMIITVDKLKCGIFRHGIMKKNGKSINPHTSQIDCEKLLRKNLIYGCGKPFQIIENTQPDSEKSISNDITYEISTCDYI